MSKFIIIQTTHSGDLFVNIDHAATINIKDTDKEYLIEEPDRSTREVSGFLIDIKLVNDTDYCMVVSADEAFKLVSALSGADYQGPLRLVDIGSAEITEG